MPALAVTRAAFLKEVNGHLDFGTGALISGDIGVGKSHFVREVASNRTIANELFLSRRTVDNHLGSVYSVLGVSGRAELADIFGVTQSAADVYSSVI